MDCGKAIAMYRERNTRVFNPDKCFSKEDIDAAFKGESNLFNSIEDGISILDTSLNIVRVNFTMQKWYAHKPRLVGQKCFAAYHDRGGTCAGSTSKEIAEALHLAKKTVDFHRGNIRAKLKLQPGRDNLRSFLIRSHIALD